MSRYVIELRQRSGTTVLGETDATWARSTALAPYAAALLGQHAVGELVLVETATGAIIARRELWPEEGE